MGALAPKYYDIVLFTMPFLISIFLVYTPFENFLSEYPFYRSFPWYFPWRGVIASLLIWMFSGVAYSLNEEKFEYLLWGSALSFAFFHYLLLMVVYIRGYRVTLYPLFFQVYHRTTGSGTVYLDLAQVVLVLSLLFSQKVRSRIRFFIKGRSRAT